MASKTEANYLVSEAVRFGFHVIVNIGIYFTSCVALAFAFLGLPQNLRCCNEWTREANPA